MDMAVNKTMPPSTKRPAPKSGDAPRSGGARALSDLLPAIGGVAFKKFGFVQSSVVSRWPEIVGARFAAVSAPESIRFPRGAKQDGTLHLVVRGAHGTMMQHIAPEIVERVNRFFGYAAVARVVMRQGDVAAATRSPRPAAAPPSLKPVPTEIGDSLRAIADPELKAVLAALAAGVAAPLGPSRADPEKIS
ncbi:MAG: DUF721 domain-containing protein [Sphingomonas sp.]|nr:DUF721 domain-containing protein [Sphingomonas sp.]